MRSAFLLKLSHIRGKKNNNMQYWRKTMKILLLVIGFMFLLGCQTINKSSTLKEPPFATVQMKGTPSEAATCVGRYWQSEIGQNGSWQIWTLSNQVVVAGPGLDYCPRSRHIGLVVEFQDQGGKTIALAHCHNAISKDEPQRTVTLKALDACKAP
jgi:hypothetical protein